MKSRELALKYLEQGGNILVKVLRFLGSAYFAVGIILVLAVILGWATFLDSLYGADAASAAVYRSWWFLALGALLGVSILASTLTRLPWRRRHTGFLVTHLGLLVLMAGCAVSFWLGDEATLGIYEGQANSVAVRKTCHFLIEEFPETADTGETSVEGEPGKPADAPDAAPVQTRVPFAPGPFSWTHYAELPRFPWALITAHRGPCTVWERDGVRLEVLDYRNHVILERATDQPDIEQYAIRPVPLGDLKSKDREKRGMDMPFVKIRLTVDSATFEGWLRLYRCDPLGAPPSEQDFEAFTLAGQGGRKVRVALCQDTVDVGFSLQLVRFNRRLDPGTSMAAHYSSDVRLVAPDGSLSDVINIQLNQPVDFQDRGGSGQMRRVWRVFQTEFRGPIQPSDPVFQRVVAPTDPRDQLYLSWFTVSYTPGRGLLYLGCLLVVLGIGIMFTMRAYFFAPESRETQPHAERKTREKARVLPALLVTLATLFSAGACAAQDVVVPGTVAAAEDVAAPENVARGDFDFSRWETLPALHQGRIMPLDALARLEVRQICGRERVRVSLVGAELEKRCPAELRGVLGARLGISATEARRFGASELLFAWMVEPELWEYVPFLPVENVDLRTFMGLPDSDPAGPAHKRLAKASPAQVRAFFMSDTYAAFAADVEREGVTPQNRDRVEALRLLETQFLTYRELTYTPGGEQLPAAVFSDFMRVFQIWSMEGVGQNVALIHATRDRHAAISALLAGFQARLSEDQTRPLTFTEMERFASRLSHETTLLAEEVSAYVSRLLKTPCPEQVTEAEWGYVLIQARTLRLAAGKLRVAARELLFGLYVDGTALHLVPALEPDPLDLERSPELRISPWFSFNALMYGAPDGVLEAVGTRGAPSAGKLVGEVRAAFASMAQAWKGNDPAAFEAASGDFADRLAALARQTGAARKRLLPAERLDREVLDATEYASRGALTQLEVTYYRLNPFLWAWVFPFAGLCLLGLGSLVDATLRRRSVPGAGLFALGVAFLVLGVLANTLGLALRSWVMGRAPVTNMFETLVFVAWTAGVLGLCFTFRHALGRRFATGARRARSRYAWPVRAALMAVVFYGLTFAGLGAGGGYSAINLTPSVAVGAVLPTLSDLVVWTTGMIMLAVLVWWMPLAALVPMLGLWPDGKNTGETSGPGRERDRHRSLYALATAFVVFLISYVAYACPSLFNPNLRNLMPVLRDNYWLSVHVVTIVASYGAGMLAWMLGNLALGFYAFGRYTDAGRTPPAICRTLSELIYRCMQAALVLLVIGTILGGLWADVSWGRFWGWDNKEVWALISLFVYLLILHGRYVRLLGEFTLAVGAILGAFAIIMAWYGVNYVIGSALHGYGAGEGAWVYALWVVGLNTLLLLAAVVRYRLRGWLH